MKISIVIPNVTKTEAKFKLLDACLSSFKAHHKSSEHLHEIIVVDDGSEQSFHKRINDLCVKYGAVALIKDKNEGFSKAVNTGIQAATGDAIVLVNNDITFTGEVLSRFNEDFQDESVGIVGGLLFYPGGTIQHGGVMRVGANAFTHIGWHKKYETAPEVHTKKFLIGVTGAIFGISRKLINNIGMFDEKFFLASEDTQYCLRAWQANFKVLYDPEIRAIHVEGGTRGASDREKMSQSVHTRNWYIQECKTKTIFLNWLKTVNMGEIDRRVNEANMSKAPVVEVHNPIPMEKIQEIPSDLQLIGMRRSGALGDVMMATPILRELNRRHPNVKVIFATQCPDALRGNPYVHSIVSSMEQILGQTSTVYDLDLAYEYRPKMHIVDAYAQVVFGAPVSDKRIDLNSTRADFIHAHTLMGSHVSFERDKVVVVHQAVSWANRTWPKQYWDQVVQNLASRGHKVVVVGRGGDFQSDMISGVVNLVNKLTIPQVREVISHAKLFIGPDSGLMHVAQSTHTPIIGFFTVANPDYRITRPKDFITCTPRSDCRFCLHEERPPVTFVGCRVGTLQCLKEITPHDVVSKAIAVLGG